MSFSKRYTPTESSAVCKFVSRRKCPCDSPGITTKNFSDCPLDPISAKFSWLPRMMFGLFNFFSRSVSPAPMIISFGGQP